MFTGGTIWGFDPWPYVGFFSAEVGFHRQEEEKLSEKRSKILAPTPKVRISWPRSPWELWGPGVIQQAGCGSKPCTPGEHQNRPQTGGIGYDLEPCCGRCILFEGLLSLVWLQRLPMPPNQANICPEPTVNQHNTHPC